MLTDSALAGHLAGDITPDPPIKNPRFSIFMQADNGWVLRDYKAKRDYPFHSKAAAVGGMELRLQNAFDFLGSPIKIDAYGPMLENAEHFA